MDGETGTRCRQPWAAAARSRRGRPARHGPASLRTVTAAHSIGRVAIPVGSRPASTPADERGDDRHGDHDEEQVAPRDVIDDVRDPALPRVRTEPSEQADVGRHGAEQRTEEGQASGRDGRQAAPGARAGPGGGERAQVARGLAPDEPDAHGEHAEGEGDAEDGRPVHDLGGRRCVVLRLDAQVAGRRQRVGAQQLGLRDRGAGQDRPAVRGCSGSRRAAGAARSR